MRIVFHASMSFAFSITLMCVYVCVCGVCVRLCVSARSDGKTNDSVTCCFMALAVVWITAVYWFPTFVLVSAWASLFIFVLGTLVAMEAITQVSSVIKTERMR